MSSLVGADRGTEARVAAVAALVAGIAFWVIDALVDLAIRGDRTLVEELLHPSGVEIWIRLLVTVLLALLFLRNRARARLRLLTATLDKAPDGIQITTLDGVVAYSNRAVQDIYGFAPEELRGKSVNEMNADPSFASRVVLPALRQQGRWAGELDVKHKDGRIFPIWLTTSVVLDRGSPIAGVGIIRDITDRKRADESLRRYADQLEEATRLKDLFTDILRHDLLGPASAIRMSLQLLEQHEPGSPGWDRLLATARRNCGKITAMIDDATRYAKVSAPQELEFGKLDLGEVLEGVLADSELPLQQAQARVAFAPSGPYPSRAHPMIAEVFWNLLSNAIKYGPHAGEIGIGVEDDGALWKVSVSDDGEGIPDPDKPKVFTRFERLQKEGVKGTGLGLAISKHIVDMHGGRIWVEDNPRGGSVFCVTVPKA